VAGYRFCRSDDAQRLVEAYNACYRVHFPELPELTLDGFKRWVRELQVWASSCMIASGDRGEPIGVLIGAKRETANCVIALGVHPDHLRQGHGSHMLQSLMSKLAILGPRRIVAEVPEPLEGARACFEACGLRAHTTYTDFAIVADPAGRSPSTASHSLVAPIGFDEAAGAGLLVGRHAVCWARGVESLSSGRERIRGLAVASEASIEAALLYSPIESRYKTCRVELLHVANARAGEALVGLLLGEVRRIGLGDVAFALVHPEEVPFELLSRVGFASGERTVGYDADASSASPADRISGRLTTMADLDDRHGEIE
jgi:GNAT superfamily N-acetyltransferase